MSQSTSPKDLSGDLSLLSLFDLCQTLGLNAATGTLRLESEVGKGYLHFEGGCLINGMDERQREGEKAVRSLFAWKAAHFSFQSGPISSARVIEMPTQSLLLDIAREQDEASAGGPEGDASKVEKLKQHEALKLAFAKITRDSRGPLMPSASSEAQEVLGALAAVPGGEILVRPARPVMARMSNGWKPMGEAPISHERFDELLRLLSPPGSVLMAGQISLPRSPLGTQLWSACGEDIGGAFLSVRCLHASAPRIEAVEFAEGLHWSDVLTVPRVEVLGGRGTGKSLFLGAAARAAAASGMTVGWGSPEPASAMSDLDLPVRYLAGGPLTPSGFVQLALRIRCDLIVWDGPASSLPDAIGIPDWGTALMVGGPGLPQPKSSLFVFPLETGRVRVQAA